MNVNEYKSLKEIVNDALREMKKNPKIYNEMHFYHRYAGTPSKQRIEKDIFVDHLSIEDALYVEENALRDYRGESCHANIEEEDSEYIAGYDIHVIPTSPYRTLVIPESMGITEIHQFAFYNTQHLVNVVCPKTIDVIRFSAFYDCSSLESIYIPKNVKYLHPRAFKLDLNTTIFFEGSRDDMLVICESNTNLLSLEKNNIVYNCTKEMYDEYLSR